MLSNTNIGVNQVLRIAPRLFPSQAICKRIYQGVLLFSDAIVLLLAFALAYVLRFHFDIGWSDDADGNVETYLSLTLVSIPIWLGLFAIMHLYDFNNLLGGTGEYTRAINGCTSGMMLVIVAGFLVPTFIISRAWLVLAWLLSIVLLCLTRLLLRRVAYTLRGQGYFVTPAVIVGTNSEAISLAEQLKDSINSGVAVVGFVSEHVYEEDERVAATLSGLPILGTLETLPTIIHREGIEDVIIATTALRREQRLDTALRLTDMPNIRMSISSGLYEIITTGMRVTTKNSVPLLSMNRLRLDPVEVALKALLDYSLICLAAPFLVLVFAVIGLLVKLDSPGPIIYRRRVLGIGGKEFDAFKFRTMVVNGDELLAQYPEKLAELKATHKLRQDPRITKMGHLLRRTSLDELPQIINVLLGQMSLVGPRMIHPDEAAMYGPYKSNLLSVKPGLTGLWQVSGRSDISYDERVQLDMHYIRNYSIWLDIQILFFQTLPAVFAKRGAY
jgi:exopolysaccharide biosynthesis polyprenyl glycosylphosphotransferase